MFLLCVTVVYEVQSMLSVVCNYGVWNSINKCVSVCIIMIYKLKNVCVMCNSNVWNTIIKLIQLSNSINKFVSIICNNIYNVQSIN